MDAEVIAAPLAGEWRDWLVLLKPRVVNLVVFTGWLGLYLAPGHIHPVLAFTAILCIAVAAGAAGCLNMWWERDIDALMHRTANRPVPGGRISPEAALQFGVTLAVGSVLVMGLATNLVAATVLALSIGFYVFVYTMWLKRLTPQNIVIGGAAGAFPPIIGWAAVTGDISVMPDYGRAGVPMLPVVAGARATRQQILIYTVALVAVSLLPWALGYAGRVYGIAAALLGLGFLIGSFMVLRDKQDETGVSLTRDKPARANFRFSLLYLAVLFLALGADKFVR
jgi:protoheme IX farnesyltransferase